MNYLPSLELSDVSGLEPTPGVRVRRELLLSLFRHQVIPVHTKWRIVETLFSYQTSFFSDKEVAFSDSHPTLYVFH